MTINFLIIVGRYDSHCIVTVSIAGKTGTPITGWPELIGWLDDNQIQVLLVGKRVKTVKKKGFT